MMNNQEIKTRYTDPTSINEKSYKSVLKSIHTECVSSTLSKYPVNRVLGLKPPTLSTEEKSLPRVARTELSRLRSGFSPNLNYYLHRLDENIEDKCPECGQTPHDTVHLFNCPSNQTELSVLDLWKKPVQAAAFLGLYRRDAAEEEPP